MTLPPRPLRYPNKPVRSLRGVAAALRIPIDELNRISLRADTLYRNAKPIVKLDGSVRQPVDALPVLKNVQKRIKLQFLMPVEFPDYLTGSLKGRDARRNAELHAGAVVVVCEDIKKFFPSTSASLVHSIWVGFFGFSADVAQLLTALTTKGGSLPEGAVTSSHLANLAFWNREPALQQKLLAEGISYSRYVDDITISSKAGLPKEQVTGSIAQIYGMMAAGGFQAKRAKHEIARGHGQMLATKLMVNRRPALPTPERQAIRTALHQLEERFAATTEGGQLKQELASVAGRVGRLAQLHPREGAALKARVTKLRGLMASRHDDAFA